MNKVIIIVVLIFAAGYLFFLKTFDQMPSEYKTLKKIELDLHQKHKNLISKLASDSQTDKKELANEYLVDSKLWILELQELAQNYKTIGKGLSMRKRSRLAGEALKIKSQIKLIKQTQIMLKNALDGKVLPEHEKLLKFDKDSAYRKIFMNIPSKNSKDFKKP